ncbi:hypothetical protein G6F62_001991 [Rhizopus arrhizus]|nr:hypothetical protein G6F23_006747 [Rhizopus arrhizus]KAG0765043.1 hypothetical protein G6F24_004732 [Rhizopus arrhizus]KAG0791660.1 hypothetical protein G6F21_004922 [Rhizopus arrhizus]KAG0795398.1 hypothetical protein G6F22_005127 [Rhizopus arrhizus]KAG0812841.1 hypothetical protein G6F20_006041 [Rhizopus arrhizus]
MSGLIDSILNNYYIPPLVFAIRELTFKNTRVCIDGKQRLTSIYRFMNNEIPYIDKSSGETIEYYFCQNTEESANTQAMHRTNFGGVRKYLSIEAAERFNNYEFVCVEYADVSEDDEFEIFNRVQLGVSITAAEKLRANNSESAKKVNELVNEFSQLEVLLHNKGTAAVFQAITQILLVIKYGKDEFRVHTPSQNHFIASNEPISQEWFGKARFVLERLTTMSRDTECMNVFTRHPIKNTKHLWKRIELLSFSSYLALTNRRRSLHDLAEDCKEMRKFMNERYSGKMYVGIEYYKKAMEWAEEKLKMVEFEASEEEFEAELNELSDEEVDELKYDSDEQLPLIPVKRSRRNMVATAKRGAKVERSGRGARVRR